MSEVVRWFPLDRIGELERAIAGELRAARRTRRRDAIAVALGLHGTRRGQRLVAASQRGRVRSQR